MSLRPGDRLGPYEVQSLIGAGGMGEVYRARDTRLDRDVALKTLPDFFANDPERLARFEREAKVLASLNHPNIAQIYGLEEANPSTGSGQVGAKALVLELVEGPTLADRVARGPIPLDEALPLATQIAEALEAAHEHGIIHRDLKPANIKVRDDGAVKVLDFGLAKALDPSPSSDVDVANSPTITSPATQMGVILGTAAYMSPEQAKGRPTDRRADVWAFGCVLYEMLTGRRVFAGDDVSDTLAFVLMKDPAWGVLPANVPPAIRRLLRRCLERDRRRRLDSMADARLDIEDALAEPGGSEALDATRAQRGWTRRAPWVVAAVSLGVAALSLLVGGPWRAGVDSASARRSGIALAQKTIVGETHYLTYGAPAAVSPDGETVVFVGGDGLERRLYLRRLDNPVPRPIPGTEGAQNPFFSPDGEWLAFTQNWGIWKVRLSGGGVVPVQPKGVGVGTRPSWGPDGSIYFYDMSTRKIAAVRDTGGEVVLVEDAPDPDNELELGWWSHLPGGRSLLVTDGFGRPHMGVLDIGTGDVRVDTTREVVAPHFVPPGTLVFGRPDGTLLAATFDPERAEITGSPVPLATDVEVANWTPQFAVSESGAIVYVLDEPDELLIEGRSGSTRPVTAERRNFRMTVSLSPDGSRVAVPVRDGVGDQVRVYDSEGRGENLTRDERVIAPIWSPDGRWITYGLVGEGIVRRSALGGGEREFLVRGIGLWQPSAWSLNAERLAYMDVNDYRPMLFDPTSGIVSLFSEETDGVGAADYSPDGGLVAFQSLHIDGLQIWLQRVDHGVPFGPLTRISREGGIAPVWSPDGRSLFYIRWRMEEPQTAHLMSVQIERTPTLAAGTRTVVADWSGQGIDSAYRFDIRPNGEIVRIKSSPKRKLILLQNWMPMLENATRPAARER